jgi:exodeoxyribonuclease V alpha subunit
MYKEGCGVNRINEAIQCMVAKINNDPAFIAVDGKKFYVGDKAMQLENNYDKDVYNGDMGRVIEVGHKVFNPDESDEEEPYVTVDFGDGRPSLFHKFQGSQCKYVIFVAPSSHYYMLSRELVYTAVTRAEKKIILVTTQEVLDKVPNRIASGTRYTSLPHWIAKIKSSSVPSVPVESAAV